MRNRFTDPAGVKAHYDWQVNHTEEPEFGKTRTVQATPNTANTGFIIQQSDDGPLSFRVQGTIFHKAQLEEFISWYKLCEQRSIYFRDFANDSYEVLITSFRPTRHRTIRNPRDYANAPLWFWRYEMEMMVLRVISGSWAGVN
jgi:hypothetical protein